MSSYWLRRGKLPAANEPVSFADGYPAGPGVPSLTRCSAARLLLGKASCPLLGKTSCPLWANSGHQQLYSITSSARASSVAGTSKPSALAVVTLMTRSNLVGCSTGISPGFAPRRILSTYSAARRYWLGRFDP